MHSEVITFVSGSVVRVAIRVYFIVVLGLVAILGGDCASKQAKIDLMKSKTIPVTSMTGWLGGFDLFWNWYLMRSIPGGIGLGLLMILTILLTWSADIVASYFVRDTTAIGTCSFTTGSVLGVEGPWGWSSPPVNGRPYLVIMNAQTISAQNGGVYGIYSLVDSSTTFVRQPQDVIAAWTCEAMGYNITYSPFYTPVEIEQDLVNRGLMFPTVD